MTESETRAKVAHTHSRQNWRHMATYGYARVSHASQSLDVQIDALKAAGCSVIRAEKKSGTSLQDRTELKTLLDFLRSGDVLVVTRIDRIARSTADLFDILRILESKGSRLRRRSSPSTRPRLWAAA